MFKNRKDAALQLAAALQKHRGTNALVLGIPRGGVEIAYYVAGELHLSFSVVVARKLGHPSNPEYAIGAVAEDGTVYLTEAERHAFSPAQVKELVTQQQTEIKRRIQAFRQGAPLPPLLGRTVLLVDDGIATGATLRAALLLCRHQGAAKVVVAAPVAGVEEKKNLQQLAEEVVILETPQPFHSVSQVYADFENLTDEATRAFLKNEQNNTPAAGNRPS